MVSFFNRRASDKRKPYAATVKAAADAMGKAPSASIPVTSMPVAPSDALSDDLTIPTVPAEIVTVSATASSHKPVKTKAVNLQTRTESQNAPQVFAFMGASGGVGTTSLATQIAYELAAMCKDKKPNIRRSQDPQVCLIDLDFEGGSCAYHLDLLPSLSVEDLSNDARRIDTTFTSALVSTHQSGISLLAVPNTPGANQRINPHAIMAMLDAASQLYRYVVIDMPRYSQSWTPAVMGGADFVGLVSELTISSLHMARDTLNRTSENFAKAPIEDAPNCHPILNKYERRSFKNTLRLNDAEAVLGHDVISTICIDSDTCREAINCGEPIGAVRPDNRYVKDSRQLIEKIFEACETRGAAGQQMLETQHKKTKPLKAHKAA